MPICYVHVEKTERIGRYLQLVMERYEKTRSWSTDFSTYSATRTIENVFNLVYRVSHNSVHPLAVVLSNLENCDLFHSKENKKLD